MDAKKISTLGYGFVIVSPTIFEHCRKDRNITDRRMISYFSKDNNAFYDFISKGAFIPIHHLIYDRYSLYFSLSQFEKSLLDTWNVKTTWESFNLHIDSSNSVWAMEIEEMEKWSIRNLNKYGDCLKGVYYDIYENEYTEFKAIKYNLPEGKYDVKIYGLVRKVKTNNDRENYGFLIELSETESFTSTTDSSETNFSRLFD